MIRSFLAAGAVLAAIASPALASTACVDGNVGVGNYTATGSCTVGPLTFSHFSTASVNNATLNNPSVTVFNENGEFGLTLNFTTGNNMQNSDVKWSFDVDGTAPGTKVSDVFVNVNGSGFFGGQVALSENLVDNGTHLPITLLNTANNKTSTSINLIGDGSLTGLFLLQPPTLSALVSKDQANFANGGIAFSSDLTDAFSVVPLPAALPLFAAGFAGLAGFAALRRRKQPSARA